MFELERFIADCESTVAAGGQEAVREVLLRAIADPAAIMTVLGEPRRAELVVLHRSQRLTILNVRWPPHHTQTPHDHRIWAEIGVYSGREDNIFWRHCLPNGKWQIEATGAASVCTGACHSLRQDAIHSVTNPLDRITAGLHVYGGDLAIQPRSMWNGETLVEGPIDHTRDYRAMDIYNTGVVR